MAKSNLLQREYTNLRTQRVRLRTARTELAKMARMEPQKRHGPDGILNQLAQVEMALNSTERRWAELSSLLGRPASQPPVRLASR